MVVNDGDIGGGDNGGGGSVVYLFFGVQICLKPAIHTFYHGKLPKLREIKYKTAVAVGHIRNVTLPPEIQNSSPWYHPKANIADPPAKLVKVAAA
jgi:hypothetical protein